MPDQIRPSHFGIRSPRIPHLILLLVCFCQSSAHAGAQSQIADPVTLGKRLHDSFGKIPWNPDRGYKLTGQFVYKGAGEEIHYRAEYVRLKERWVAGFTHEEDPSRNTNYGFAGSQAWAFSPEAVADIDPSGIPYCARYDFPILLADLLYILEKQERIPLFQIGSDGNDVYVRGQLRSGHEAIFLLNNVEYFPRKVSIKSRMHPLPAWLFSVAGPGESGFLIPLPEPSHTFEVWFSDPVDAGEFRYPGRTDYADRNGVIGSFFLEEGIAIDDSEPLPDRPAALPWASGLNFRPRQELHEPSLYIDQAGLGAFRTRLDGSPWAEWRRGNAVAAAWAHVALRIGPVFPNPPSYRILTLGMGIVFLGIVFLLGRRRRQYKKGIRWTLLLAASLGCILLLITAEASLQLRSTTKRSLLALHLAIRFAVSGDTIHATAAERLLHAAAVEAVPRTIEEAAEACQAYSLAYDLISPALPRVRQMELEHDLFAHARPLYGALQGWRSNTDAVGPIAAGLGMAGLAIGYAPYVDEAGRGIEKSLQNQLVAGLHRDGPGPGARALDATANFFYALKRSGHYDYYDHPALQEYVRATLHLLSPVGTLPLFGDTGLDQSSHLMPFFLKASNQLPGELGNQCASAYYRYRQYGRHSSRGIRKLVLAPLQISLFAINNPYVIFQYERAVPHSGLPETSAVLGKGKAAVLRSGGGPESLYLAVNAMGSALNPRRNILTFDLYAYRALLLHGPGFPGTRRPEYEETLRTASGNCITFNGEGQSGTQGADQVTALLNQPLFDHIRVLAARIYDDGRVQRDVVMVRPDAGRAGYFLMIDEVHANAEDATVAWHLHGRGKLAIGMDQFSRWTCPSFSPPRVRSENVFLTAFPLGSFAEFRSLKNNLYRENRLLDEDTETLLAQWTGSKRFLTILLPHRSEQPDLRISPGAEGESARIGATDWFALGTPWTRHRAGALTHVGEYIILRDRGENFPALFLNFGLEFGFGRHSLTSDRPVTISMDGLKGSLLNTRPDTSLQFRSPEIRAGDRFLLDGESTSASEDGVLVLKLRHTGEHTLCRQ